MLRGKDLLTCASLVLPRLVIWSFHIGQTSLGRGPLGVPGVIELDSLGVARSGYSETLRAMSFQHIAWEWLGPYERRPWPSVGSIQQSLEKLGLFLDDACLKPLGPRTAEIVGVRRHSQDRFCLARRRNPDPRIVCPLEEECEALRQMHALCPGLVPELFDIIKPNYGEPLLVLHWVDGRRLGSRLKIRESTEEVAATIASALSMFHTAGYRCDLSGLTRHVRAASLLDAAQNSPLRGVVVPSASWDRTIAILRAVTDSLSPPTLLHGDAHAYNLMQTPD